MKTIQKFRVRATLPDRLTPLIEIAHNLWWTWNPDAVSLFERVGQQLWSESHHNPIALLSRIDQERLNELAAKETFLAHLDRVHENLRAYMEHPTWYSQVHEESRESRIAYFSAEFGLHECLPFYAGGLGVLAGDHLKSASELGLPMVGVGLSYRYGYFHQQLDRDGMQMETYREHHFSGLPMEIVRQADGAPRLVEIEIENRKVYARIWRVQVGRVPLFLLDTDISENEPVDRRITHHLYDGDPDVRIRQEIVLGVGGLRALQLCDVPPTVCHLNEGHSAFLTLERIATLMERHRLTFAEAREIVSASTVFTTHTPVPAGNEVFPPQMVARYLRPLCQRLQLSDHELIGIGRVRPEDPNEPFSTTVLALRLSTFCNGVSKLHGEVARAMWRGLWPDTPESEIPITHITNGVHLASWYSEDISRLLDRYLGLDWLDNPVDQKIWQRVTSIPDTELWRARERLRTSLVAEARTRLRGQLVRRGAHPSAVEEINEVLDPDALTICFARRFATYKRAALLFRDKERLARIINNPDRPVQFIFAGKAHPKDQPGKELIRTIIKTAELPEFRRHIVFLEDYDIRLARTMVRGADVWLNTPRRPLEASGTSGMKAAANGALNLSVLDGWWCEAHDGENGWAIGNGQSYDDLDYQDRAESEALYNLLEQVVSPMFYERNSDGIPREWLRRIKCSLLTICPVFNTNRAAEEYTRMFYIPALVNWNCLLADDMSRAKRLAHWKSNLRQKWPGVQVLDVHSDSGVDLAVGDRLTVQAQITLSSVSPEDVNVEIFYGTLEDGRITHGRSSLMTVSHSENGSYEYTGVVNCHTSGHFGYSVRVTPRSTGLEDSFDRELIAWWEAAVRRPGVLVH
jgi:glycogen phosphorylase